jgi:ABC-type phosphate/phosphonate transport system substrate-binding protein
MNFAKAQGIRLLPGVETGAHRASFRAVAEGRAALAAIDALTWALISEYEDTSAVKVIGATDPTPALPYITALGRDAEAIFDAVAEAILHLGDEDRRKLHLKGIVRVPVADYLAVPIPPAPDQIAQEN